MSPTQHVTPSSSAAAAAAARTIAPLELAVGDVLVDLQCTSESSNTSSQAYSLLQREVVSGEHKLTFLPQLSLQGRQLLLLPPSPTCTPSLRDAGRKGFSAESFVAGDATIEVLRGEQRHLSAEEKRARLARGAALVS
eukprot:762812-Hanusia_phi.AAC.3